MFFIFYFRVCNVDKFFCEGNGVWVSVNCVGMWENCGGREVVVLGIDLVYVL